MTYSFIFTSIDPVAFSLGPLEVRWYGLAYIAGLLGALMYGMDHLKKPALWPEGACDRMTPGLFEKFLLWATLGVFLGGRLGYVVFYNLSYYWSNPLEIGQVWHGGMSFHGGFLGVLAAGYVFARHHRLALDGFYDLLALGAPIGLFFGRIANFLNAELYGRVTSLPWGVVFPHAGPMPRHPSQLYEALLEGFVLFVVLKIASDRYGALRRPGLIAGLFSTGYGLARLAVESVREPDVQIGYLWGGVTLGMVLSLPLLGAGLFLILRAFKTPASP